MGWKGHHTLHGNNQKFSGRTTENHEKEPEQMVFWAKKKKNRTRNLQNTKEEREEINCDFGAIVSKLFQL